VRAVCDNLAMASGSSELVPVITVTPTSVRGTRPAIIKLAQKWICVVDSIVDMGEEAS